MATFKRVPQTRLKSSFIYLANAVNDLRGNWTTLALVLAPLVLVAALCVLPDALNLQHKLAVRFAPGVRSVAWIPAQAPYAPLAAELKPLFPAWALLVFHIVALILTFMENLVVLCTIRRIQAGPPRGRILNQAVDIYRDVVALAPSFLFILLLQLVAISAGLVLLIIPGLLAIIRLYFAQYALVFDNHHGWSALARSNELMRKRFFKVATRIVVFLAVWSGFNSWVGGAFFAVSLLLGPISVLAGSVWATVFALDLVATAVGFITTAFFIAAGVRLYQDLTQIALESATATMPPTAPLPGISA